MPEIVGEATTRYSGGLHRSAPNLAAKKTSQSWLGNPHDSTISHKSPHPRNFGKFDRSAGRWPQGWEAFHLGACGEGSDR